MAWGKEHLWGEARGSTWNTLNPRALGRSRGPEGGQTHRGVWGGCPQAALTSLHVVKGARASCGISAQL